MKSHTKTANSFLSKSIYEGMTDPSDFWYIAKGLLDWENLAHELEQLFKNNTTGATNYSPVQMLKMLFVQRMYNASDRATSGICSQTINVKYFLGLEIQEMAPDFTTLCKFRNNIIKQFGEAYYKGLFDGILATIKSLGVEIGESYAVDSTITLANVNTTKDADREEALDHEATWTAKSRPAKDVEGKNVTRKTWYYGYKSHILSDLATDIITTLIPTTASVHDGAMTEKLIQSTTEARQ